MPLEPIDVAVDLGLLPPPLPPILTLRGFVADPPPPPPETIEGVLHQGCKMILSGTSKSNKTWGLLDLGLSVAGGEPWWGRRTARGSVLYVNFELPEWAISRRIEAICQCRQEIQGIGETFHLWNLRGHSADITFLRPDLQRQFDRYDFKLIIMDPAYKLLGDRDENANSDITSLLNEFERIACHTGAAVVLAHHFAKGDPSVKEPIDRMSGAGAWARDPDSIMVLTPHEEPNCYTVSSILRNFPILPEFVLTWDYPIMRPVADLNPSEIRSRRGSQKSCTDAEFLHQFISDKPQGRAAIIAAAGAQGMSRSTVDRYLFRLVKAGIVANGGGMYWLVSHQRNGNPERAN